VFLSCRYFVLGCGVDFSAIIDEFFLTTRTGACPSPTSFPAISLRLLNKNISSSATSAMPTVFEYFSMSFFADSSSGGKRSKG
jgi:hypothetical protein